MITAEMYKNHLSAYGSNLSQVKRNQSDKVINSTFIADAQYKKVYILLYNVRTGDGMRNRTVKLLIC